MSPTCTTPLLQRARNRAFRVLGSTAAVILLFAMMSMAFPSAASGLTLSFSGLTTRTTVRKTTTTTTSTTRTSGTRRLTTVVPRTTTTTPGYTFYPPTTLAPSTTSTTSTTTTTVPATTTPPTTAPPASSQSGINTVDRILYCMSGANEGAIHGVPSYWSWAIGPSLGAVTPPAGMTAMTAWGQIYADSSDAHPANVRVEMKNIEAYVWSISRQTWVRVQGDAKVDGAHYVENFAGNSSVPTNLRVEPDGGVSTDMVSGYNFHFWPNSGRGLLPNPSDIGAVYTTMQARLVLDDPNGPDNRGQAHYLANMGADWWRDLSIGFGDGSNNPGVGQGRFTYLSSNWSAVDFFTGGSFAQAAGSWTDTQLRNSPPPMNVM